MKNKQLLKEIDRAIKLTKRYPRFGVREWRILFEANQRCLLRYSPHTNDSRIAKKYRTRCTRFLLAARYLEGGITRHGYKWMEQS